MEKLEERIKMKHFYDGELHTIEEKLSFKLSEKLVKEYNNFIKELVKLDPINIIDRAYEKVCKQEMVYVFEKQALSATEYKALLRCSNILNECYDEWLKSDGNFNEMLEYTVENRVDIIVNDFREKNKRELER